MGTETVKSTATPTQLPVKLLAIYGGIAENAGASLLLDQAIKGAENIANVQVNKFDFTGKKIECCRHCPNNCAQTLECIFKDDFEEFKNLFAAADGILISVPLEQHNIPAPFEAALERLNEIKFSNGARDAKKNGGYSYPRFLKVGGTIALSGKRFGGQEEALRYFANNFFLLDSFPVGSYSNNSAYGINAYTQETDSLLCDDDLLTDVYKLGVNVASLASQIKAGKQFYGDALPSVYRYSETRFGSY